MHHVKNVNVNKNVIAAVAVQQKSNIYVESKCIRKLTYDALVQSLPFAVALRECKQVAQHCFMFVNTYIKTNHTSKHTYIMLMHTVQKQRIWQRLCASESDALPK